MSEAPGAAGETLAAAYPGREGTTRRLKSWIQLNVIAAAGQSLISIRARIPGLA